MNQPVKTTDRAAAPSSELSEQQLRGREVRTLEGSILAVVLSASLDVPEPRSIHPEAKKVGAV